METNNKKNSILSKRILAYLIDVFFLFTILGLISQIKFINPTYDKYNEAYESYTEILENYTNEKIEDKEFNKLYNENYYLVSKYSISYNIVIILGIFLYFGVFQKFNKGQTLGKKLMKIKVISNNYKENISVFRYFLRILPMYYIYIGGLIPLFINSILIFILNKSNYMIITMSTSYVFLLISIISFIMICSKKYEKGIHDIISKTKVIYEEK